MTSSTTFILNLSPTFADFFLDYFPVLKKDEILSSRIMGSLRTTRLYYYYYYYYLTELQMGFLPDGSGQEYPTLHSMHNLALSMHIQFKR
jgi:hypothetical protein